MANLSKLLDQLEAAIPDLKDAVGQEEDSETPDEEAAEGDDGDEEGGDDQGAQGAGLDLPFPLPKKGKKPPF